MKGRGFHTSQASLGTTEAHSKAIFRVLLAVTKKLPNDYDFLFGEVNFFVYPGPQRKVYGIEILSICCNVLAMDAGVVKKDENRDQHSSLPIPPKILIEVLSKYNYDFVLGGPQAFSKKLIASLSSGTDVVWVVHTGVESNRKGINKLLTLSTTHGVGIQVITKDDPFEKYDVNDESWKMVSSDEILPDYGLDLGITPKQIE